ERILAIGLDTLPRLGGNQGGNDHLTDDALRFDQTLHAEAAGTRFITDPNLTGALLLETLAHAADILGRIVYAEFLGFLLWNENANLMALLVGIHSNKRGILLHVTGILS